MQDTVTSNPTTEDSNYRYYAFISYSRKDKVWGEWVQKKIENYRLPTALRHEDSKAEGEIPKFVRPIFRDTTDMIPQGGLSVTLKQELLQSKYLIVICSPSSAKPNAQGKHWVNAEIEEFQRLGRGHRIVPFIVEGDPESLDASLQCYPPALANLEDKPLGISVHENANAHSKVRPFLRRIGLDGAANDAVLKLLAVLLGVRFDDLKRRHLIRARQRAMLNTAIACSCMALGFWYYDANYREKIYYYADYVERYGVPEGIYPLEKSEAYGKDRFYRFNYVGGKLKELTALDNNGRVSTHDAFWEDRPSRALFGDYDSNGRPKSVQYFDDEGNETRFFTWTQDRKAVDFKQSKSMDSSSPLALSANMTNLSVHRDKSGAAQKKSTIIRFLYEYDASGFAKKMSFMSSIWEGDFISDVNGVYGYLYERNEHNAIVKKTFMGADGKPMQIQNGTSSIIFDYTKNGLFESIRFVDMEGNLVEQERGYAKLLLVYSAKDTLEEMQFIGSDGIPFAIIKAVLDPRGNVIESHYLDANRKPLQTASGYVKEKLKYDAQGNKTEEAYFDIDDNLVLSGKGYAIIKMLYDAHGRILEERYYGVDGKPVLNRDGFAIYKTKYNEQGRIIEQSYGDVDGKPILIDNIAKMTFAYNEKGYLTEAAFFDTAGQPVLSAHQCAKIVQSYDSRGNRTKVAFFGVDGKPIMSFLKCASATFVYDNLGEIIEVKKYDVDGNLLED